MTVWCLGSINVDYFYSVPHIPAPGETLAAREMSFGLGGKGANQSVAAAMAGVTTYHIGAIGSDANWILGRLGEYGVETQYVMEVDRPTGHAIITVSDDGENAITLLPGANRHIPAEVLETALGSASSGDVLLVQNETNLQKEAACFAKKIGLTVLYSAAPFQTDAVSDVMEWVDFLLLNAIEARQLEQATGQALSDLGIPVIVVTMGAEGARWMNNKSGESFEMPGVKVSVVDTTGAGDTFAGYLAASLSQGKPPRESVQLAIKASALKVTRRGTADAIPSLGEVDDFVDQLANGAALPQS